MTNLYDMTWPVNFIEQKTVAKLILDRVKQMCALSQPVYLRQLRQPSQQEWETAWVSQTGQPLPITIGAKLIWFDLNNGECKTYTTINDIQNGLASSGTIVEYIDTTYERPSFRLLGVNSTFEEPYKWGYEQGFPAIGSIIRPIPAYVSDNFISISLGEYDFHDWATRGLDSLIILYRFRGTSGAGPYRLRVLVGDIDGQSGPTWFEGRGTIATYTQSQMAEFTQAANNYLQNDSTFYFDIGLQTTLTGGLANAYSEGMMFLTNMSMNKNMTNNLLRTNELAGTGLNFGSYVSTLFAAGNLHIETGSFVKNDEYQSERGWIIPGTSSTAETLRGKIWIYGLFKGYTGEFS